MRKNAKIRRERERESFRASFSSSSSSSSCLVVSPRRKIVERSIYGYKITHVKFEAFVDSRRVCRRDLYAPFSQRHPWKKRSHEGRGKEFLLARSKLFARRVILYLYLVSLVTLAMKNISSYALNTAVTFNSHSPPPSPSFLFPFFSSNRKIYREREEKNHDFDSREHAMDANIPLRETVTFSTQHDPVCLVIFPCHPLFFDRLTICDRRSIDFAQ